MSDIKEQKIKDTIVEVIRKELDNLIYAVFVMAIIIVWAIHPIEGPAADLATLFVGACLMKIKSEK